MIALDTETSGIDVYHGCRPFLVTIARDNGEQVFYEWNVDPKTRKVDVPKEDLREIQEELDTVASWGKFKDAEVRERHTLVCQNGKFDAAMLIQLGLRWPWDMMRDTLVAGHLLGSNQPHDLTSMVLTYLGVDIEPLEKKMEKVVKAARDHCRRYFPTWRIAKEGLPEAPSVKGSGTKKEDKVWRNDLWLPRTLGKKLDFPESHEWMVTTAEYANADSKSTLALWMKQKQEIERRGLWNIFLREMKLPRILQGMESRGVTISGERLEELRAEFKEEAERNAAVCVNIAKSFNYNLELPKAANNKSLITFCFGEEIKGQTTRGYAPLQLPIVAWTEAGNPSLDSKIAIPTYLDTLSPRSKQYRFIDSLSNKRKRDTALTYLDGYQRYWLPRKVWVDDSDPSTALAEVMGDNDNWYVLHPNIFQTGTDTLRLSSSNPNSQNASKQEVACRNCTGKDCPYCEGKGVLSYNLRYAFGPAPGREWWCLDYENIELRIPAYESGEQAMIELFEKPNDPPYYGSYHLLNASIIYPDLFNELTCPKCLGAGCHDKTGKRVACREVRPLCLIKGGFKKKYASSWYQWCKNAGFALIYGCQEEKFDLTAHKRGAYRALKSRLTKLFKLNDYWCRYAEKHGYVETLPDKDIEPARGYPILCSRTEWGKILPTVPLNYHVQSTAMQCARKSLIRCQDQLDAWNRDERKNNGDGYYLTLHVHDENVFDFPARGRGNLAKVQQLQRLMEKSGDDIGIPLTVAISYCPQTWSKSEELKEMAV